MERIKSSYNTETKEYLQNYGYDLRGVECEIKDGKEICFVSHRGGR